MTKRLKQMPVVRLTEELYSKPHLISPSSFNAISTYLENRNRGMLNSIDMMKMDGAEDDGEDEDQFDPMSGIGVINIQGALTYRPIQTMCGVVGNSYQAIYEDICDMVDEGAKTIILNFDSGGGEAYGIFELSNDVRKKCDEAGVSLLAYIDGQCCSAAYALACMCDQVISNPMGESGSVGVLIGLIDSSKAMEMEGLKRTFIYAGDEKIPFAEDGGWKESFLASLQESVDSLYQDFAAHVSKYTGLSIEEVKATQAKVYSAKDAMSIGLVNKIMTRSEFIDYVVKKHKRGAVDAESIS